MGVESTFVVESRDDFGNLRRGDGTNHFGGYGDTASATLSSRHFGRAAGLYT